MGVEPYLIASSVVGLVAQRLVRKICPRCGKEVPATAVEQAILGGDVTTVHRGEGCAHCNGTGYRGRVAVHELVAIDPTMRRMITSGADADELTAYAREKLGMKTLREKGIELVRQGVTTPEELAKL